MRADYPEAYRRGWQDFYGRKFKVTPDVLIPRPETEQMIDMALGLAGKSWLPGVKAGRNRLGEKPRILDVGTGSGCIGITLKLELPEAKVALSDISKEALMVAQRNAKRLGAEVELFLGDLLDFVSAGLDSAEFGLPNSLEGVSTPVKLKSLTDDFEVLKFDLIMANLPYLDRDWPWLQQPESQGIRHEPELALYAKDGGLELIERLLKEARGRTRFLILEADPSQHEQILELAGQLGYREFARGQFCLGFLARPL